MTREQRIDEASRIAELLVHEAMKGNLVAVKEIMDRLEFARQSAKLPSTV